MKKHRKDLIAMQRGNVVLPKAFLQYMIQNHMTEEITEVYEILMDNPVRLKYMELGLNTLTNRPDLPF